jgi:putative transposase
VEIVYLVPDVPLKKDNGRYAAIDLGINNLAAVSSNSVEPLIMNGKPLKAINHYFNQKLAELRSKCDILVNKISEKVGNEDQVGLWERQLKNVKQEIGRLYRKRDNKVTDYLHKASRALVNYLAANDLRTLIIGYNAGWKQGVNLKKLVNQNFVQIPFLKFVKMVEYKCEQEGIQTIRVRENYTSKCSFLDGELPCKHDTYMGSLSQAGIVPDR